MSGEIRIKRSCTKLKGTIQVLDVLLSNDRRQATQDLSGGQLAGGSRTGSVAEAQECKISSAWSQEIRKPIDREVMDQHGKYSKYSE